MEHGFSRMKRKKKDKTMFYYFLIRDNPFDPFHPCAILFFLSLKIRCIRLICVPFHFLERWNTDLRRKKTEVEG